MARKSHIVALHSMCLPAYKIVYHKTTFNIHAFWLSGLLRRWKIVGKELSHKLKLSHTQTRRHKLFNVTSRFKPQNEFSVINNINMRSEKNRKREMFYRSIAAKAQSVGRFGKSEVEIV